MPIGLDDTVDEGFTPAELLDGVAFADVLWIWGALAGDPETTGAGGASHRGGDVIDEVGGCCGFLCEACPAGVTIHGVALTITTADGRLAHTFSGRFAGPRESGDLDLRSEPVPLESLQGTLPSEAFLYGAYPFAPTEVFLVATWQFETGFSLDTLELWGDDGEDQVRLGRYEP
jgi:hypothetical protein